MAIDPKNNSRPPAGLPSGVNPGPPPALFQEVAFAADLQWNRPIPEELQQAIQAVPKSLQSLMQLLDSFPVTLAMQFAVAYGWLLRDHIARRKTQ